MSIKNFILKHFPLELRKKIDYCFYAQNINRVYKKFINNKRHLNLRLDTNNICNLKCIFCYRRELENNIKKRIMSYDEFKMIADKLFPITELLSLSCATEPTLTPNFEKYIELSCKYNIPFIEFVSNGLLLNDSIIEISIRNKLNKITISIDAASKELYEKIRINSNFDKVINNLEKINDLKKKLNIFTTEIVIEYTAFDLNIEESIDFVKKYHNYFDTFFLNHLLERKRNKEFLGNRVSIDVFKNISNILNELCLKYNKKFISGYNEKYINQNYNLKCITAMTYRLISSDGNITMCNKDILGNVYQNDYFVLIKNSKLLEDLINKNNSYCKNLCMS